MTWQRGRLLGLSLLLSHRHSPPFASVADDEEEEGEASSLVLLNHFSAFSLDCFAIVNVEAVRSRTPVKGPLSFSVREERNEEEDWRDLSTMFFMEEAVA